MECIGASLMAQMLKNLPVMQETWVRSLGWEDALEKGVTILFNIPAWRISMDRGDGGYRIGHIWVTNTLGETLSFLYKTLSREASCAMLDFWLIELWAKNGYVLSHKVCGNLIHSSRKLIHCISSSGFFFNYYSIGYLCLSFSLNYFTAL